MTIDEAKYKLSQKMTTLKSLLHDSKIELINTEGNILEFTFNGYSYVDAFINDLETEFLFEIKSLINLSHLNELNLEKRSLLAQIIIEDLESDSFFKGYGYEDNIKRLSVKQRTKIEKFLKVQILIKKTIINSLRKEYLSDSKFMNQKLQKVVWKGNQRELAELFDQLEAKEWIEGVLPNQRKALYRTIVTLFDIPEFEPEKIVNNFQDYHKPSYSYPLPVDGLFSFMKSNKIKQPSENK